MENNVVLNILVATVYINQLISTKPDFSVLLIASFSILPYVKILVASYVTQPSGLCSDS